MTTSQEMDQQFGDSEIERRLKLIEDKVNGYDAGGMDLFRQFGYFQLSNLPRFDQYGVQIQTSAAQTAAIFFLENFVANPIGSYPQAAHFGQVSATTVLNMLTAALSASSASTLSLVHTGTTSTLQFLSTNQVPAIIMTPGAAGDPASLQDGMLWYNSTTNKFYVRTGSVTRELSANGDGSELTIATGVITATTSYHRVDTEADAATDDLTTINGGTMGQFLTLRAENGARDVVVKDGTGNLQIEGDFTMNNVQDTITLIYDSNLTAWLEVARSNNGA
jgi:hypothetical protein